MSTNHEAVIIIRPSFKKFCEKDACRAALFNQQLYLIARKAKSQTDELVKSGGVYWYGSAEEICTNLLDDSWCVNKVRKEIKNLVAVGLIGQRHNPKNGWDQTRHYFFGEDQGKVLKEKCEEAGICLLHIGLHPDIVHLLYLVNAIAKDGKCNCQISEMHLPNMVAPFTIYGNAIPVDYSKTTNVDYNEERKDTCVANATDTHTFFAEQDEQPELLPDDNATEDENDTYSQSEDETELTEEVEQDVPQEQQSSAAPPDAPGKKPKRTRKRRVKLEKPDELLQARIDRVYSFFDALAEETTGVEKKHARNDTETAAIIAWLQTNPTEKVLQEVYKEMWDEPTNTRTGFSWKKNMKIHNVLSQYESRALPILAARKKVEQKKPPVDITTIDPRRIRGSEILPEGVLLAMIEAEKKETEEQAKPRMTSAEMRAAAKLRVAAEEAEKARRA